ncbi:MAG: endonuclease/exonuclease/phosphatase family protein [Bacillota bacterium]
MSEGGMRMEDREIVILTWNIARGKHAPELSDICRLIEASGADIVTLQEVDRFAPRSGMVDQAAVIARHLRMNYVFGANVRIGPFSYGNLILSRFPLGNYRNILLPSSREPRGLLHAEVYPAPGQPLSVFTTHLGLDAAEREAHARIINQATGLRPHILTGDFNSDLSRHGPAILLSGRNLSRARNTYPAALWSIDYVLTSAYPIKESYTIPTNLSDHLPVVARIILNGEE